MKIIYSLILNEDEGSGVEGIEINYSWLSFLNKFKFFSDVWEFPNHLKTYIIRLGLSRERNERNKLNQFTYKLFIIRSSFIHQFNFHFFIFIKNNLLRTEQTRQFFVLNTFDGPNKRAPFLASASHRPMHNCTRHRFSVAFVFHLACSIMHFLLMLFVFPIRHRTRSFRAMNW